MKRFIIILAVVCILCSCKDKTIRTDVRTHSEFVAQVSESLFGGIIYFDNYSIGADGKYTFYDKDYKYAGECIPGKGFAIGRNLKKVKEVK